MYLVLAGAIAIGSWGADVMVLDRWATDTLAVRAVWSVAFFVGAFFCEYGSERAMAVLTPALGAASVVALTFLAVLTGGHQSAIFGWYIGFPLVASFIVPDEPFAVVVVGVGCSVAAAGVLIADGAATPLIGAWLMTVGTSAATSYYGSLRHIRQRDAELAAVRAKTLAEERAVEAERLARVQQLAAVGGLAAGVAHEINNPLSVVVANVQMLQYEVEGEQAEILEDVVLAVDRISTIARDLTSASRPIDGEPDFADPTQAIDEAMRLTRARWKNRVRVVSLLDGAAFEVAMGHGRLVQVLINLIVNACDALEDAELDEPSVRIHLVSGADGCAIRVEDNGPGIPTDLIDTLFEPFFTTKARGKGTGLGLYLCRTYAEQADGRLKVSNGDGGGATFELSLPRFMPESVRKAS